MKPSLYFPLFVDLSAKKIVVIGAGTIARRRVQVLSDFTEHITVIASDIHADIQILANEGKLTVIQKKYEGSDINDADIVLAATNDVILNQKIAEHCIQKHILVNNCSDRSQCDFYFPGIIHTGDIVIGVTANGKDHGKAKQMTEQIKKILNRE